MYFLLYTHYIVNNIEDFKLAFYILVIIIDNVTAGFLYLFLCYDKNK